MRSVLLIPLLLLLFAKVAKFLPSTKNNVIEADADYILDDHLSSLTQRLVQKEKQKLPNESNDKILNKKNEYTNQTKGEFQNNTSQSLKKSPLSQLADKLANRHENTIKGPHMLNINTSGKPINVKNFDRNRKDDLKVGSNMPILKPLNESDVLDSRKKASDSANIATNNNNKFSILNLYSKPLWYSGYFFNNSSLNDIKNKNNKINSINHADISYSNSYQTPNNSPVNSPVKYNKPISLKDVATQLYYRHFDPRFNELHNNKQKLKYDTQKLKKGETFKRRRVLILIENIQCVDCDKYHPTFDLAVLSINP